MNRAQLEHAIRAAGAISGEQELYVVGSQSILGAVPDAHPDLTSSMEVDIAPTVRPELEEVIEGAIGEYSPFHTTFRFWVDGVDIAGITLPDGWQGRLVVVDNPNTHGYRGLCLDPADLAVSKLAAGRPKDIDFVRVLFREGIVTPEVVLERIGLLSKIDSAERERIAQRSTIALAPHPARV